MFFADTALLLLVLFTAGLAVWSWFKDRAALTRLVLGGVGVLLAYAASSTLKLVFTEARPCQSIHVALAETCPPPGDWSWPSNHSVLAAAFAAACALAVVRLRWYLAAVALLIAAARVGVGAHYLHDVLFGLGLGLLVVLATVHLLPRLRRVLPSSVPWVRQAGRRCARPAGETARRRPVELRVFGELHVSCVRVHTHSKQFSISIASWLLLQRAKKPI
ncbi:phosphatase PAP2 family protein [Glutamicibacter protophormiae]|uniref:phosphatase PAP2 family protein n=1 Tax=Glutamicibacter protophormiae TaxID=37930 RepID=UPI001EF68783|nr:phosphatase PAP2 family protein [Glutamicibacter protophormiae]